MGVPAFGTIGVRSVSASNNTLTPALPASISAGDLLFAFMTVNTTGQTPSASAGWTAGTGSPNNTSNITGAWWFRVATGADSAPVLSWATSAACAAQVLRFTGANGTIGNTNNASANTSTTETIASITTTADNSLMLLFMSASTNQTIAGPKNYTVISQPASVDGSATYSSGKIATSGSPSDAASVTITSANWVSFGIEIIGTGASVTDLVQATQSFITAIGSDTTTNIQATQSFVVVIGADTTTNIQATQSFMTVLRTVADIPPTGPGLLLAPTQSVNIRQKVRMIGY